MKEASYFCVQTLGWCTNMPDDQSISDSQMVIKALGEPELFSAIIDRYEAPLKRYIRRLGVHSQEDQDDVLQEIFIKVYRNLNAFDQTLKFSSWIYRIAHNEAISWFRKNNVRPEGHLIAESEEIILLQQSKHQSQETLFDIEINAEAINEGLKKLDPKYQEVLILRFFEHKEYEEISDILKIPIGSVGHLYTEVKRGSKTL